MTDFKNGKARSAFARALAFGEQMPAPKTDLTCGFIAEAEKLGWPPRTINPQVKSRQRTLRSRFGRKAAK